MIVIQNETELRPHRLLVNVYGEFTLSDFHAFESAVNQEVNFAGAVDLLMDLREMHDFTLDMALEDVEFVRDHPHDFRRIAIISDSQWVSWGAWLTKIFVDADLQVFSDEEDALAFLSEAGEIPEFDTIISASELSGLLYQEAVMVFDCRHDLMNPKYGKDAYAKGHIPGAFFKHLDEDLSAPKNGKNGRHPLPDPLSFGVSLGTWGVTEATQVVVYDDAGGLAAARLWWMMKWLGHTKVALLDGGYAQWTRQGYPVSTATPTAKTAHFEAHVQTGMLVQASDVVRRLSLDNPCLIDARAPERFSGEKEPIDPVAGHIPGAKNRPYLANLTKNGTFRSASELRADWLPLLGEHHPAQAICYCGSGVTGCQNILAMEIAGLVGAKLYAGSWSQWCAEPSRPVEKG